jgi:hypothetical protein
MAGLQQEAAMPCMLTTIHHDPDGRLYDQTVRVLPVLQQYFPIISVLATETTLHTSLAPLEAAGVRIQFAPVVGHAVLGRARKAAVSLALQQTGEFLLFCDFDRILHWAEYYPEELVATIPMLEQADFSVIGRTERAFASHPRTQRDTEAIVNHVFAQASGMAWDVTAAARGLSRSAAQAIVMGCAEESVGTDTAWPLFLLRSGGFTLQYLATEGMEFETADRFADDIATAGGYQAWMNQLEGNVREWELRLEVARCEVAAITAIAENSQG